MTIFLHIFGVVMLVVVLVIGLADEIGWRNTATVWITSLAIITVLGGWVYLMTL